MHRTVLHVAQPTTAGVARVVADLSADLVQRGWEVAVACPAGGRLAQDAQAAGAAWRPWEASRSPGPSVVSETRRLAALIADVSPDVVHLHSSKAGLAGRAVLRGRTPTVFQPHAWSFLAVDGAVRAATLAWERAATRWCHALAVVSEREQEIGRQAGVDGPYVLLPNGVDLQRYRPAPRSDRGALRGDLGLPPGPLAVCAGRLGRQKGQDVLLRAWPAVRRVVPDARLVLVGDGPDRAQLEALASPGVDLVGAVDDTSAWLRAADVVVLPSRWEGMPLALLEGMASGRPVVASDVAGAAEALAGGGGVLVAPEDEPGLAAAVAAQLQDPDAADAEGAAGRAHVEQHFDLSLTTAAAAQLYERLLAGR